jgi:hypothetical protein
VRLHVQSNGLDLHVIDKDSGEDITDSIDGITWKMTPKGPRLTVAFTNVSVDVTAPVGQAKVEMPSRIHNNGPMQTYFTPPDEEGAVEGEFLALPDGRRSVDDLSLFEQDEDDTDDEE